LKKFGGKKGERNSPTLAIYRKLCVMSSKIKSSPKETGRE